MSTKFLSPGWRMPRNANQSKAASYSLNFDGNNNKINASCNLNISKTVSVSVWVKTNTNGGQYDTIFLASSSGASRYGIEVGASGKAAFVVRVGSAPRLESTTVISGNTWKHIVGTYDGTNTKIYVNGSLENTGTLTWTSPGILTATDIAIGGNPGYHYEGQITQGCIFNYTLSQSQINTLYGTGSAIGNPMALPNPPKTYYPLGKSAWDGNFLTENNAIGDYVFSFDGSDDYIDVGNSDYTEGITTMSISGWFNPESQGVADATGIVAKESRDWYVGWYSVPANSIRFLISDDDGVTKDSLNSLTLGSNANVLNKWHHFVCTWDASDKLKIYINGSLSTETNSVNATSALPTSTNILEIGRRVSNYFNGGISNIQIWNSILEISDVETLYNYGSPIQTLANIPQSSNLKAWYKLDASEIYDSSSTEWSVDNNQNPSAYQSSLDFVSSESDYITVSNSTALSSYSISCWVNARTLSSYGRLVSLDSVNHRFLGLHSDGTLISGYASPGWDQLFTTSTINTDTWNHIVLVDNGTNTKIYVNTVENTLSNSIAVDGPNYYIGSYGGSQNFFDGKLSNVSIWNTALTSAQITEIYNNGTPSSLSSHSATSNLVSWYKLNNTTTGIQDSKGSNNGTNNGATEYPGFVNALAGESSGMTQANLVQSDLQTVAPYSKYAMKLDDATLSDYINVPNNSTLQITGNLTLSSWVRIDGSYISNGHLIAKQDSYVLKSHQSSLSNKPRFQVNDGSFHNLEGPSALSLDTWHHITGVREGNSLKLYVNGALVASSTPTIGNLSVNTHPVQFNAYTSAYSSDLSLSNNAIWNVALNASEIREIYNEGLPSNLNTFSGTAPISWWQLGENSSFDGSNWKYADEMSAGNNADSVNTAETALTNGVGTTANGTSTGMAVGALVGDAPYSTANAVSSGMAVQAFDSANPPNVISGRSEDVPS